MADGTVTDVDTGLVYTWNEWRSYKQSEILEAHVENMANRDQSSDLINSPGIKPWFRDDLFGIYPDTRRPPPEAGVLEYP